MRRGTGIDGGKTGSGASQCDTLLERDSRCRAIGGIRDRARVKRTRRSRRVVFLNGFHGLTDLIISI